MAASDLHREIAVKATRLLMRLHSCQIAAVEYTGGWCGENVDGCAFNSDGMFLVEAKVSRADFLADAKKPFRRDPATGVGKYRYYACPEGLIKPEELPPRWGLIYVNQRGHVSMPVGYGGRVNAGTAPPPEGRSWGDMIFKYYGSWEKGLTDPDPLGRWPQTEIMLHTFNGVEARDHFRFNERAKGAEWSFLLYLAKRHKEQKFMGNIL